MSAEIALAEQHDAAGRHDDAINALARATKRGDVEATTRLGTRLVAGDRAPYLPADGARLLADAVDRGGGEAAARLAVLLGAGAYVAQSWRRALELLVLAAERGWPSARQQLEVLAMDDGAASQGTEDVREEPGLWRRLGTAVDFEAWSRPAPSETLHAAPLVRRFGAFLPQRVCSWLIDRSRGRLERAKVYDASSKREITHSTRTNTATSFKLMESDLVQVLVQSRMAAASGVPLHHLEALGVLHYDVGEEIDEHFDFIDPRSPDYAEQIAKQGQRVITFLIYLNDDYAGGETGFAALGLRHKGGAGDGLSFVNALPSGEPDLRSVHAGLPIRSGEKWVVSQFVRDRRFLGV